MADPTIDHSESWLTNIDTTIPITDTICDQNSLSHPSLIPVLSPGNAMSASIAATRPITTGIKSPIASPNVASVKKRENMPAVKIATIPSIPKIIAHQGAIVIRMSLTSFGRWGAFSNRSTSWSSSALICFFTSVIVLILRIKCPQYNLINSTCNRILVFEKIKLFLNNCLHFPLLFL